MSRFLRLLISISLLIQGDEIFRDILFGIIGLIILLVIIIVIAYILRSRLMRKELSLGPNKILLLPDDLEFIDASSSTMLSKVSQVD